jgi:ABC-type transport system involved in multi-copper enzyme maturation permease subunit
VTADARPMPRLRARVARRFRDFWAGISAVGTKEVRGRMRGRRAFVVLTIYLLLLSIFAFGIYQYLREQADTVATDVFRGGGMIEPGFMPEMPVTSGGTALAANIGHAIFSGLLIVETILILVLAPAFTSGAISLEREKQTLDLLVATPLSTLGMVLGKLISALGYVFLLIIASIPLASLVFAFGGVGPEDLLRGYVLLFAVAFGMGAIGFFISALVRRTQTATVVTFVVVLALTIGTAATHEFVTAVTRPPSTTEGFVPVVRHRAPEAILWLNPLVADLDLVCTTVPSGYHETCSYLSHVTGKPYFGSSTNGCPPGARCFEPGFIIEDQGGIVPSLPAPMAAFGDEGIKVFPDGVVAGDVADSEVAADEPVTAPGTLSLGFPRDTFWPRSSLAFVVLGVVLVLASTQLIAPSRRLRLPRLRRRGRTTVDPSTPPTTEVQA